MSLVNAEPIYFGPSERPLFGWIHLPDSPADRADAGLVLCNPFGYEAVCAHRAFRHLCAMANELGMPAIRFDYDGTGDSAGDDDDPNRIDSWLDSIDHAINALKQRTGVARVCVLGLRLGALLAAFAAAKREDVVGYIAIAPVVKAKSYLRELRAFNAAIAQFDQDESPALQSAGFYMTRDTLEILERLDVSGLAQPPAKRILIFDRSDFPMANRWTTELQNRGANVVYRTTADYEKLAAPPHSLHLPSEILGTTRDWLKSIFTRPPQSSATRAGQIERAISTETQFVVSETVSVIEQALFLDELHRLFGVVTSPASNLAKTKRVGILLLNAGATHHIGPGRLHVSLARSLAREGYVIMRLDITGIGDSPVDSDVPENTVYSRVAVRDVVNAIAVLRQRYRVDNVIAGGLCAGGYHAFKAALANAPISCIVMINPLTFYWKDGMSLDDEDAGFNVEQRAQEAQRYQRNIFRLETWLKLIKGKADIRNFATVTFRRVIDASIFVRRECARLAGIPVENDLASDLKKIVHRKIQFNFIFSDGDLGLQRLLIQGGATVSRLVKSQRIGMDLICGADHTVTQLAHRHTLVGLINKIVQQFASDASSR